MWTVNNLCSNISDLCKIRTRLHSITYKIFMLQLNDECFTSIQAQSLITRGQYSVYCLASQRKLFSILNLHVYVVSLFAFFLCVPQKMTSWTRMRGRGTVVEAPRGLEPSSLRHKGDSSRLPSKSAPSRVARLVSPSKYTK